MSRNTEASSGTTGAHTRIDKWLWVARFFKTRSLATQAVDGGHAHLNGQRVKPARDVHIGDRIEVSIGETQWTLIVKGIAERRGSAEVARQLYEETPESAATRQAAAEKRHIEREPGAEIHGRPTKKSRRQIIRFTER